MSPKKIDKKGLIATVIICSLLSVATFFIIQNKQYIVDQIIVWNYKPTAEITALIDRSGMNDNGKFLYYASQPTLEPSQNFNNYCDRVEATTSILGCYSNNRIYIYDVVSPELDGIREVTATHETLHAIYARLGDDERNKIDKLLENEYQKLKSDKNLEKRLDYYATAEPGQRDNELYSMIGTEVANIDPELENYYKKYFTDRQKVVALNYKYNSVFDKLNARADELINQMGILSAEIKNNTDTYNSEVNLLNNDISDFNAKASSGYFSTQSQFNKARNLLINRVNSLDALRATIDSEINNYNVLQKEYNSIATETKKLSNSMDSTLAPMPSI